MPTLLIIGAGYVGAELARLAQSAGWEVISVTKSGDGETRALDVSDLSAVQMLAADPTCRPDVIVHCASSGRGGEEAYRAVFLHGVENLQSVWPEVPLVFVSSSSVYAQTNGETVTEESPTEPSRETGKILLQSEAKVLARNGTVARLSGIYGPRRSVLIRRLLAGEAQIEEDGRRLLNQIHQQDAASALLFLASDASAHRGEIYNVTDSTPRSQRQTYEGLCARLDLPLPPVGARDLNRKRGWTHKAISNHKLCQAGWTPRYPDFLDACAEVAESL